MILLVIIVGMTMSTWSLMTTTSRPQVVKGLSLSASLGGMANETSNS